MLPENQNNVLSLSPLLKNRFPFWTKKFIDFLSLYKIPVEWLSETKDIWARDYSPVQIYPNSFISFRYDPSYLKGYDAIRTSREPFRSLLKDSLKELDLVLDGGNVVSGTDKVILTDKIYKENPSYSSNQLKALLGESLDAEPLIIPQEPYDPIGHSDGILRFIDDRTVLVNDYSKILPAYHLILLRSLGWYRLKFRLLPYAPSTSSSDIPPATGNYVNFLRFRDIIIVPIYSLPTDDPALKIIESSFPSCQILPFDFTVVAKEGGAANCISWTYFRNSSNGG